MLTDLRGRQFDLLVRIQKRRPWYRQRGFLIGCLNPALDTRRATVAWNLALQSHMDTRHIKEKSIFYTTTLTLLLRYINFQFEQVWIKVSISRSSSSTRCPSSVCSSLGFGEASYGVQTTRFFPRPSLRNSNSDFISSVNLCWVKLTTLLSFVPQQLTYCWSCQQVMKEQNYSKQKKQVEIENETKAPETFLDAQTVLKTPWSAALSVGSRQVSPPSKTSSGDSQLQHSCSDTSRVS